jgi:phospholipid/cholesterol/gamma-HCH transport system permease protein
MPGRPGIGRPRRIRCSGTSLRRCVLCPQPLREKHGGAARLDVCYIFSKYNRVMDRQNASFAVNADGAGRRVLALAGDWTIWTIGAIEQRLRSAIAAGETATLDVSGLRQVDTSGAFLINRVLGGAEPQGVLGEHSALVRLLSELRRAPETPPRDVEHHPGLVNMVNRIGHGAVDVWRELLGTLSFIGETVATVGSLVVRPHRIRWTSVVAVMEEVGLDALPIVCFLSFFIGLVIAFIGANLLAMFNATVFTVELVGIGVLREFGVVLTAILLAGRTDSAFTAQIGSMKMRQEIDAMRVMGLDPMEAIVAPRLLALLVMTPLLTFAAMISGIAGGLVAAWAAMGISPTLFIERFQEVVPAQHFWVGIAKAPVFALVVALVGCRQGLLVDGDVTSLGRRTTASVVQSIFLVITLDAVFAVLYYLMNV